METRNFKFQSNLAIKKAEFIIKNVAGSYAKPLWFQQNFGDADTFLGRQIITDVKLVVKDYQVEQFNPNTKKYDRVTVSGSEIVLDTVLVDVRRSKNIIETTINGMDGTVKEYISNGDYQIQISGAIISNTKGYPFEDVKKLVDILNAPVAIEIHSELLSIFNVFNIVVKDKDIPSREGYTNTQLFAFNCSSDTPLELKL